LAGEPASVAAPYRAALELSGIVLLVVLAAWLVDGQIAGVVRVLSGVLIAVIAVATHRRRLMGSQESSALSLPLPQDFRGAPDARAWGVALAATLVAVALIVAGSWLMGWWTGGMRFDFVRFSGWAAVQWWAGKLAVVSLQQVALQLLVFPLCCEMLRGSRRPTLVSSAAIFGALHLPNLLLAGLTAGAAALWCSLYLRRPRLLPLIVSHLILAVVARAACGDAIYNMRVGASVLPLLPRTVVAEDGQELRFVPRSLEGFVDDCRIGQEAAECWGWLLDLDRREVGESIEVLAGGGLHRYPVSRVTRQDVADHFGMPQLVDCGFRVELPAAWFEPGAAVRFFGVASTGQSAELEYGAGYEWEP